MPLQPGPQTVPNPDPTVLTTENLRHEIETLHTLIEARLSEFGSHSLRMQIAIDAVPALVQSYMTAMEGLQNQKFSAVNQQFSERDARSSQTQIAQKEFAAAQAVAAQIANTVALSAQKEASAAQSTFFASTMAERQGATTKQIDNIVLLLASTAKASDDKISAITQRLDRADGISSGNSTNQSSMLAIMAVVVSLVVGGVSIFSAFKAPVLAPAPAAVAVVPLARP